MRIIIALLIVTFSVSVLASEPLPWQMLLQPAASPIMEELNWLHNFLLAVCAFIVFVVLALLVYVCIKFNAKANPIPATFSHNVLIEVIWTVIPVIILIAIAIPSFRILRMENEMPPAEVTIKVVGYQWYWNYSYPDHDNIGFDSYVIADDKLKPGQRRLLEVDNRLVIPENTIVKFLITAADVIHSFAVPALGIKTDAVPGRVNETWTKVTKKGVYYGQCSELCGVNHGFMPIALEVVSKDEFDRWLIQAKSKFSSNNINTKIKIAGSTN
ncbi:Cytochrome c oxidase subunit II [Candidatus Trichorickettsia mobilis]|uniref:Cytochrome c oxidase subunit 2 n=1 Tax=Candidatus Trichorickettsia mobilis TaxID=1346319 RepID=A0ABZ0UTF6_9RICK|nr:cytochrome c oxidase subunit II [Candidatus Trichorickettsia mobilis]WPY01320.1 Cytochrome c oxidase subunit II [Candidatus Trichorickettsia mobilis]